MRARWSNGVRAAPAKFSPMPSGPRLDVGREGVSLVPRGRQRIIAAASPKRGPLSTLGNHDRTTSVAQELEVTNAQAMSRSLAFGALLLAVVACEAPPVRWVDDVPMPTTDPSPLTHPPFVVIDSTMRDSSSTADRLLVQDLLRETTALTLLTPRLLSMSESREIAAVASGSGASAMVPNATRSSSSTISSGRSSSGASTAAPGASASDRRVGQNRQAVTAAGDAMAGMPGMAASRAAGTDSSSGNAVSSEMGTDDAPRDSLRCARSLRTALARGRGRVAVWWTRRERGRVRLVAAWRDTIVATATMPARLGAWRGPIVVDTLDQGPEDAQAVLRGAAGCAREAPSVVVDDAHGYVHVGYALTGPEGPGVFYAHQMDPRAGFEVPQAIVYGERLGVVRVAARGDVVAVAYDDPNGGERPRIGLAVSATSGHIFADRIIASSAIANARDPYVVTAGRAIVVGWSETPTGGGDPVFRVRRAVVK